MGPEYGFTFWINISYTPLSVFLDIKICMTPVQNVYMYAVDSFTKHIDFMNQPVMSQGLNSTSASLFLNSVWTL